METIHNEVPDWKVEEVRAIVDGSRLVATQYFKTSSLMDSESPPRIGENAPRPANLLLMSRLTTQIYRSKAWKKNPALLMAR